MKEFADDNFKLGKNDRKLSKWVENVVGKGEIARYGRFLVFTVFSKDWYCRQKPGLVWERVNTIFSTV